MSRWIDADAVKEALKQNTPQYMWGEVLTTVNVQPYIDIVRCAECKWDKERMTPKAVKCIYGHNPDDFCSYGCRKEE